MQINFCDNSTVEKVEKRTLRRQQNSCLRRTEGVYMEQNCLDSKRRFRPNFIPVHLVAERKLIRTGTRWHWELVAPECHMAGKNIIWKARGDFISYIAWSRALLHKRPWLVRLL